MISMKRAPIFLLLGPALIVAAWLVWAAADKVPERGLVAPVAILLFTFSTFVAAIAGLIDGYLARAFPAYLRASLTAIAGATIAVGPVLILDGASSPQWILMPFAIGGAVCMGICSLLSNDYGRWQRLAVSTGDRGVRLR
jgi:hypothetical protein